MRFLIQAVDTRRMAEDSRARLVETVSSAPSPEWINYYFDLVEHLLSETDLTSNDPRLVTSLPQKGSLPITVNNRYALVAFREEDSRTEFILPPDVEGVDAYLNQTARKVRFNAIYDEEEMKRPWFVGFDGSLEGVIDEKFKSLWLTAVTRETRRAEQSPYRRYHEPIVCKAASDNDYRQEIIRKAF